MKKILYSAINSAGSPVTNFITMDSIADAKIELQNRGFIDITFHNNLFTTGHREDLVGLSDSELRREAEFQIKAQLDPKLILVLWETTIRNRWFFIILAVVMVLALYQGRAYSALFVFLIGLIPLFVSVWRYRFASAYNKVSLAVAYGDWDAVIRHSHLMKKFPSEEVVVEADVIMAQALAAKGELEMALDIMSPTETFFNQSNMGLYQARLATIHGLAGDVQTQLQLLNESYLLSQSEMMALDLAMAEFRQGSVEKAQSVFNDINPENLDQICLIFYQWLDGLLKYDQHPQSLHHLKQSLDKFEQLPNHPVTLPSLALCTADYAIRLYHLGESQLARSLLIKYQKINNVHADKKTKSLINRILPTD